MSEPRKGLLERFFGEGVGKQKRDEIKQAADALDAAGVKRKELPTEEEKPEEMKMDAGALADQIIAMLAGADSPEDKKTALVALLNELMVDTAEVVEMSATPQPEMDKGLKSLGGLLDTLVKTQSDLATEQIELGNQIKALTPLNTLAEEFKAMKGELFALKAILNARPRAASQAAETVVNEAKILEQVKKQVETFDPFWGAPPAPKNS